MSGLMLGILLVAFFSVVWFAWLVWIVVMLIRVDHPDVTVVDVEVTPNRWGVGRVASNKIQIGPTRISGHNVPHKCGICFELAWIRK